MALRVLELDLAFEPPLLQSLLDFVLAAKLPALAALIDSLLPKADAEEKRIRSNKKALKQELLRYGTSKRLWYFARLELAPVHLNLTFRAHNNWGETVSLPIPNLVAAPLTLSAFEREHLLGIDAELAAAISNHYKVAALKQVHKLVMAAIRAHVPSGVRAWQARRGGERER